MLVLNSEVKRGAKPRIKPTEEGSNGPDNALENGCNAVDDGHQTGTDSTAKACDLFV